ncbi:hypothetical protein P154DRAFT_432991 [Amniculicola lignicola CBS 123094]|uniref:Uncharacterized protein n=1 Tax=Amniculicola lignicola CBS 123094 TaxID=1392246 RepID=A0A6A5WI72_9PLEO|nr:hypothetical protein P154DRAFT_432991 [Amniculicola lignicola CBS 123094]
MRVKREVPQEHAHENVLTIIDQLLGLNNPDGIQAAVFGLLGAAAAIQGAGDIEDADCLQQATADIAFTNAKEAGDVDGQVAALLYRALERNTGSVGLESVLCESLVAVNPEIAAITQHQDPAADGAAALNKAIALELVKQIVAVGGDPALANEASTFAPGEIGDPTGAGNTCDDATDLAGCINTLGLRVDDLSAEEIAAAAEEVAAPAASATAVLDCAAIPAATTAAAVAKATAAPAAAVAGEFGDCADPTIVFGIPSDGRQEDAFEANDLTDFPHGSALNIKVISSFICDQLVNKCKADADAVDICDAAAAAVDGLKGQDAADVFNALLGF